jgi:hypothetical protein
MSHVSLVLFYGFIMRNQRKNLQKIIFENVFYIKKSIVIVKITVLFIVFYSVSAWCSAILLRICWLLVTSVII